MRKVISLFLCFIALAATSCIKDLADEGIYDSTLVHGVVLDQRTQQPVPDMRVTATDGDKSSAVVYTGRDGCFEISVSVEELGKDYYLQVAADSLYELRAVSLQDMPFGVADFDLGTVYVVGPDLPVVVTDTLTEVTASSVRCAGQVTDGGKSAVVERGFVYGQMQYPTVENYRKAVGNGLGGFEAVLSDLAPHTVYYVRAYARNGVGIGYGRQLAVTTLSGMPEVVTAAVSNITPTAATAGGEVLSDGGFAVTARGVCWSTSMQPTIDNSHTTNGSGLGTFVSELTMLEPGTTYYLRAYAKNASGVAYGEQTSFTTPDGLPSVSTADVTSITGNSALCGGTVTADGGFSVTARGVCFSTTPNPTVAGPHTSDGAGIGSFVSHMTSLAAGTTYYVRAYATNGVGTVYGVEKTFSTEQ